MNIVSLRPRADGPKGLAPVGPLRNEQAKRRKALKTSIGGLSTTLTVGKLTYTEKIRGGIRVTMVRPYVN